MVLIFVKESRMIKMIQKMNGEKMKTTSMVKTIYPIFGFEAQILKQHKMISNKTIIITSSINQAMKMMKERERKKKMASIIVYNFVNV